MMFSNMQKKLSSLQISQVSSDITAEDEEVMLEEKIEKIHNFQHTQFFEETVEKIHNLEEAAVLDKIPLKHNDEKHVSMDKRKGVIWFLKSSVKDKFPQAPCCSPVSDSADAFEAPGFNSEMFSLVTLTAVEKKLNNQKEMFPNLFQSTESTKGSTVKFDNDIKRFYGKKTIKNYRDQTECMQYTEVPELANLLVSDIIETSIDSIKRNQSLLSNGTTTYTDSSDADSNTSDLVWPSICDFTTELGKKSIEEYLNTWTYEENWLYFIDYLIVQSNDYSDFYIYEAKWSIPTYQYPIPQATASVYFTIEVSKLKPPVCFVDVTYVFEGSRLVHTPKKMPFCESFLSDIVTSKLSLYKRIRYYFWF